MIATCFLVSSQTLHAQVSPEEHAKHHPEQSKAAQAEGSGTRGMGPPPEGTGGGPPSGMMGGGMMGGDGGMMGGGMGGMMEKMGAPKPKDLYPSLMELPDMPLERRGELEQEAHARMISGTQTLISGFDELSQSAAGDDFAAMQAATVRIREGLGEFESGLAAHRALREGKPPRNIALAWFKREMNLNTSPAAVRSNVFLWGMTPFHTSVMAVLMLFAAAMIWMYYFKMRRASALLDRLATAEGKPAEESGSLANTLSSSPSLPNSPSSKAKGDCCDSDGACPSDAASSEGLLPATKRKLCRLRVAKIIPETDDVKSFRLVACHGGGIPFSYLPGQFLTFTLPVGDKPIRRSYTISSSPTQGYYCEVTVKREEHGAGSCYLHDQVSVGDTLEVVAPSGRFTFTGEEADDIVLIAGGVGITPMMSIARALTDMCWQGEIDFIVACRDPEHFIFETELQRLQECNENLRLHVAMSRIDADRNGYHHGRLTKEMLAEWVPNIASKRVHICGAPTMMEATKAMLAELNVLPGNIHTENFGSAHKPKPKAVTQTETDEQTTMATQASVTFASSGKSTHLLPDETILEASERVGIDIDYSCRVGTCGICVTKLLSGNVNMEVDDGLEPEDREAGMILACQAKSDQDVSVDA